MYLYFKRVLVIGKVSGNYYKINTPETPVKESRNLESRYPEYFGYQDPLLLALSGECVSFVLLFKLCFSLLLQVFIDRTRTCSTTREDDGRIGEG